MHLLVASHFSRRNHQCDTATRSIPSHYPCQSTICSAMQRALPAHGLLREVERSPLLESAVVAETTRLLALERRRERRASTNFFQGTTSGLHFFELCTSFFALSLRRCPRDFGAKFGTNKGHAHMPASSKGFRKWLGHH